MTNSQLLKTPVDLLDAAHRQQKFLLLAILIQHSWPKCLKTINQIEASGLTMDQWDNKSVHPEFACPHCQTPLVAIARLDYEWGRKLPDPTEATEQPGKTLSSEETSSTGGGGAFRFLLVSKGCHPHGGSNESCSAVETVWNLLA